MSLFRKTVGVRCVGKIDPKCENFVNHVLLRPHRSLCDRCGDTVEAVTAPNKRLVAVLLSGIVVLAAAGSVLVYRRTAVMSSSDLDSSSTPTSETQAQASTPGSPQTAPPASPIAQVSDEDLRSRMGEAARLAGSRDFDGALRIYLEVEKQKAEFPLLKSQIGGIYFKQGRQEDARRYLQEALAANPNDMTAHYNLACVLVKDNQIDQAIAELRKAIEGGFRQSDDMANDPDLSALKNLAAFKRLVGDLRKTQNSGR